MTVEKSKVGKMKFIIAFLIAIIAIAATILFFNKTPLKKMLNENKKNNAYKIDTQEVIINELRKPNVNIDQLYADFIIKGDSNLVMEEYTTARTFFIKALKIKHNENYPKQKIAEIDSILTKRVKAAKKDGYVLVEGGTFYMGNNDGEEDEKPQHYVTVSSFYMDKYEVSVEKYKKFCNATNKEMPHEPKWGWHDDDPIVNVSWHDASEYAKWAGKRLPTEAEWEYAARGGNKSKGYTYSGSKEVNEVAWHWDNSGKQVHEIGTKKPNELGIYDLTGNVWEWCLDWYNVKYHLYSPRNNPQGPETGEKKILRGGSWYSYSSALRVTYQSNSEPGTKYAHIGFRCVWNAENRKSSGNRADSLRRNSSDSTRK